MLKGIGREGKYACRKIARKIIKTITRKELPLRKSERAVKNGAENEYNE